MTSNNKELPNGTTPPPARGKQQQQQGQSVRVVVRVRALTDADASSSCSSLSVEPNGLHVTLNAPNDKRTCRQFSFDAALDPRCSQEDVYAAAGVQQLVDAAAMGYHSTVFAYGQTGSGKTYTMEGYRYVAQPSGGGPNSKSRGAPSADFEHTPEQQLGLIPRAVDALFTALQGDASRRSSVRCSYVQIYKEQAYDLLNPAPMLVTPGGPHRQAGQAAIAGGALRMRWSKAEDFYLENLFKVEVSSAQEALALFRSGVQNKVMASHKLNASSSRSHCLLTLYIDSSPLASPTEVISSRFTLVDLAGSERGATVGATEGKLRDESVAINKSLFTLRQVITCLSGAAPTASQQQTAGAGGGGGSASSHVPYRDSKLTSLLKNSLGGNSMTLMVACLAPMDSFFEENLSTLEYASKAARITNLVALNEDAKTRLVRELRAEVAFLRQQLAAVQFQGPEGTLGLAAGGQQAQRQGPSQLPQPPQGVTGSGIPARPGAQPAASKVAAGPARTGARNVANGASKAGAAEAAEGAMGVPGSTPPGLDAAAGVEELRQRLLDSAQHDVGILVNKLLDAISMSLLGVLPGPLLRA